MSIPFVVLMAISFAASPAQTRPPFGFLLAMPFVYLILGFIFTAIGAWVYNKVASWVGGIEYTSTELP